MKQQQQHKATPTTTITQNKTTQIYYKKWSLFVLVVVCAYSDYISCIISMETVKIIFYVW